MGFGALLTDDQGVPFYIDGTRPLTLISRLTFNVNSNGTVNTLDLYQNDGAVRFVFIQSNGNDTQKAEWLQLDGSTWRLYATSGTRTVTVFIFGFATQPVPAWGIAIWDANGTCILTNESKVLRDVTQLGDVTNANASGYLYRGTLGGSWAVAPVYTGLFSGTDNSSGQPRPVNTPLYASAYYDGTNTVINSHSHGSTAGVVTGSYSNARNTIIAVNVARY